MNGKILNKEALKAWILSKMVTLTNNLIATTPGISAMDAAQGPVIQGQIDAINSNLKGFEPILDNSGKITGYKTNLGGADTVFPFRSSISAPESYVVDYVNGHGDATTLNPEFSGFEVGKQYFFIAACSTVLVDCEWVGSVKAYTGAVVVYFGIFTAKNSTLQLFKSGSFAQLNAKVFMLI